MSLQTNKHNSQMTMNDYRRFVEDLAVTHRAKHALRCLMTAGSLATAALREGLRHPEPAVRIGCCMVLDHYLDPAAAPELIENLHHENEIVRAWAMHALACDRCKEDELSVRRILLANSKSRNFNGFQSVYPGGAKIEVFFTSTQG